MKKILILSLILFSIFLTSCWNEQNIQNNNNTETEIQEIVKENKESEIVIEEKKVNKKILIMKNNNVFLNEEWKEDIVLTTKASGQKECKWNKDREEYSIYKIIQNNWKYWIVMKEHYICWAHFTWITYFWIDLNSNSEELEPIYEDIWMFSKIQDNMFYVSIDNIDVSDSEEWMERWIELKSDIINKWFKKEWNLWIKKIDLSKLLPNKKESKTINNNLIDSWKYSHTSLINDWYKLNKLEAINEYYKKIFHDEETEIDKYWDEITLLRWYTELNTIYIEWNKILDFSIEQNWWLSLYIKGENKIFSEDLTKYISQTSWYPIQPIFQKEAKVKVVIDDLDTIKVVDKNNWIDEILWKR